MGINKRYQVIENPVITRIPRKITMVTINVIVSDNTMNRGSVGRSICIFVIIFFLSRNTVEDRVTVFANAVQGTIPEMR
jgi:hypothetical protein